MSLGYPERHPELPLLYPLDARAPGCSTEQCPHVVSHRVSRHSSRIFEHPMYTFSTREYRYFRETGRTGRVRVKESTERSLGGRRFRTGGLVSFRVRYERSEHPHRDSVTRLVEKEERTVRVRAVRDIIDGRVRRAGNLPGGRSRALLLSILHFFIYFYFCVDANVRNLGIMKNPSFN